MMLVGRCRGDLSLRHHFVTEIEVVGLKRASVLAGMKESFLNMAMDEHTRGSPKASTCSHNSKDRETQAGCE